MNENTVLNFWFNELDESDWWKKDQRLDDEIKQRFGELHQQAMQGELSPWRQTAQGRLAEIIVLDQFSRNMFRDTAKMFAADSVAVVLAQEAIHLGQDKALSINYRRFIYMPLMHSESLIIHELAQQLFATPGLEGNYEFEIKHKVIIERFGRYPHRNAILGRESTAEELAFLQQLDSSF